MNMSKMLKSDLIKIIGTKNEELVQLRYQVSNLQGQLALRANHTGLSTPHASAVYQDAQRTVSRRRHLMDMAQRVAKELGVSTRVVGDKIEYLQSPGLWVLATQEQSA